MHLFITGVAGYSTGYTTATCIVPVMVHRHRQLAAVGDNIIPVAYKAYKIVRRLT